jgi:hypothetical protein
VRVPSARIRQHEHTRALQRLALRTGLDAVPLTPREHRSEQRDADEGDHLWPPAPDLAAQGSGARGVFFRPQRVDAGCGARDEIRDAEAPFRESPVVEIADGLRHESRFVKKLPEPVRVPGEMVPERRRTNPGVDPDEEDANGRPNAIAQTPHGP